MNINLSERPLVRSFECGFAEPYAKLSDVVKDAKFRMEIWQLKRFAILFKCDRGYALVWVKLHSEVKHIERVLEIAKKYPRIEAFIK